MNKDSKKTISKIMTKGYEQVKDILTAEFPYLSFYIAPNGNIACWVKVNGRDSMGIQLKYLINVGTLLSHHIEYLTVLNEKVKIVSEHPDEFFFCTECGEVLPRAELEDSVFAGYYCKQCAKKQTIKNLIEESHKAGFYD